LTLDAVFVPPGLLFRPAHQVLPDAVRGVPERLRGGSHPLWEYLTDPQTSQCNLVICGAVGSGKTTLLKHSVLTLARGRARDAGAVLPVFLCLREMAATIATAPGLSLAEVVAHSFATAVPTMRPRDCEWLLHSGRALVLCDSLDELPDSRMRRMLIDWLRRALATYPAARFVLALDSIEAYPLSPVDTLVLDMVAPNQEQVRTFVRHWYLAAELAHAGDDTPEVRVLAQQGADDLWNRLRAAPMLATTASTPLLLTLAANLHYYGIPLPERRADLYAAMTHLLLGRRQPSLTPEARQIAAKKQRVLRALAYEMMCRRQNEMPLSEALPVMCEAVSPIQTVLDSTACIELLEAQNGLLVRTRSGALRFAHAAFQSALAAEQMQEQQCAPMLAEWVHDPWWHTVLRMYAEQIDATAIVEACLAADTPDLPVLMLAVACAGTASHLQPATRSRLEAVLEASVEDADPLRRARVAEALLAERLQQMVQIGKDVATDTSLLTCAEYQLFLDEQQERGQAHWPDHWPDGTFPAGHGRKPVLGVRPSDALAFCEWLTRRDSGEWHYRLPWLGRHSHEPASGTCLVRGVRGSGYWGRTEHGLAGMRTGEARPLVSPALLTRRYTLDLNHIAERLRALCHILSGARAHAHDLGHLIELGHDQTSAYERVLAQARELVGLLDRACDHQGCACLPVLPPARQGRHEHALDVDVQRFHNLDVLPVPLLDAARTRALAVIHASALAHARDLATDVSRTLAPQRARAARFAAALAHDLDDACGQIGDLTSDLAHEVAQVLDRSTRPADPDHWRDTVARLRAVLPAWATLLACEETAPAGEPVARTLIDACLEVYVALVVLEERAADVLQPLEGICIVRERVAASD
jgi:hypothetical protein